MGKNKRLSDDVAETIMSMIKVEKKYNPGDKLPNELQLSEELGVSRITLREAIRILVARNVLEIKEGKRKHLLREDYTPKMVAGLEDTASAKVDIGDLYEMRLIFEPEIAYYATIRASDRELERIFAIGKEIEELLLKGIDYTHKEMMFHCSIANATHNEFINQLEPVLHQSIEKGVYLYETEHIPVEQVISEHRMIMEFMKNRNAEGARSAMRVHIMHAIDQLEINKNQGNNKA